MKGIHYYDRVELLGETTTKSEEYIKYFNSNIVRSGMLHCLVKEVHGNIVTLEIPYRNLEEDTRFTAIVHVTKDQVRKTT